MTKTPAVASVATRTFDKSLTRRHGRLATTICATDNPLWSGRDATADCASIAKGRYPTGPELFQGMAANSAAVTTAPLGRARIWELASSLPQLAKAVALVAFRRWPRLEGRPAQEFERGSYSWHPPFEFLPAPGRLGWIRMDPSCVRRVFNVDDAVPDRRRHPIEGAGEVELGGSASVARRAG